MTSARARFFSIAVIVVLLAGSPAGAASRERPLVQLGLLLDTSNSMDGLIEQAKSQLWKFVNEFAAARKDGKRPELEVALYEYGKRSLPAEEGYLRMIVPLTTDLDKVSEELFALTTNGGNEYCGKVILAATEELLWSPEKESLKILFIAGNEPFTQGDVDYREACRKAIEKGILVNTIFCGPHGTGISTGWRDGALLAEGSYMNIDHQRKVVHIEAPQDKEIARLGVELNKTYIAYGAEGKISQERQRAQDANAGSASPGSLTQRAICKASCFYRNASWDLVDAVKEGKVKLEELKEERLPEEMRKMTLQERRAYVEARRKERGKIQECIQKLNEERKKFVAAKRDEMMKKGEANTLDVAIIKMVREQASKKNFDFK